MVQVAAQSGEEQVQVAALYWLPLMLFQQLLELLLLWLQLALLLALPLLLPPWLLLLLSSGWLVQVLVLPLSLPSSFQPSHLSC